jgi:hypothetical protein
MDLKFTYNGLSGAVDKATSPTFDEVDTIILMHNGFPKAIIEETKLQSLRSFKPPQSDKIDDHENYERQMMDVMHEVYEKSMSTFQEHQSHRDEKRAEERIRSEKLKKNQITNYPPEETFEDFEELEIKEKPKKKAKKKTTKKKDDE